MLRINHRISIPLSELQFSHARSGGPGGQNVNKVSSKVTLHWDVAGSESLPEEVKQRFLRQHQGRLTKEGELVLSSQRYRQQRRNRNDCLMKLRQLVLEAAVAPKRRKPTAPTRGSKERRLQNKREASEKKQRRQRPSYDG